jgi:periplasmic protein CpxP/Spy
MNKIKFLSIAVVALVLLNLTIIGVLFFKESRHPLTGERHGKKEPKNIMIERLNFDDLQIIKYENLIKVHRSLKEESNQNIHDLKNVLYSSVAQGSVETRDSIVQLILVEQKKLELINYNHFADIRKMCNADQAKKFDGLSKNMLDIFSGMKPR